MSNFLKGNTWSTVYKKVLCVGGDSSDHAGLTASEKNVWTDDGADGKTAACFQLSTDTLLITSTNHLAFQDSGTYIFSSANGDLDLVSDGVAADSINLESTGGITLDAGSTTLGVTYEDDGTPYFRVLHSSSDVILKPLVDAKDIVFQQYDENEVMRITDNRRLYFYDEGGEYIASDGTDFTFASGNDINLTATTDINIPASVGLTFGADTQKIEVDGSSNLEIDSGANLTLDSAADIILDAAGGDFNFKIAGTEILRITDSSSDVIIRPVQTSKDIIFQQRSGTEVARIENDTYLSIAVGLRADAQDGATLGTASYQFSDLFLADGAIIALGDDSDITLTHVADTGVTIAGAHANGTNLQLNNTAGDGDSAIQFALSGTVAYTMGVEDGDSDKFVINYGTGALGAAPALEISSAGAVNIPGALTSGTFAPDVITLSHATDPILTIDNAEHAGSDGSGHCTIIFSGENGSGTEVAQRAKILVDHPGTGTDEKGDIYFKTNSGSEGTSPGTALKLEADNDAIFYGDVMLQNTKKLYLDDGNNTYIHESSGDVVGLYVGGGTRMVLDVNSVVSLSNNDSGSQNTIFGKLAADSLDAGSDNNTFIGYSCATASLDDATNNVGVGTNAFLLLTQGDSNVAVGTAAMASTTTTSFCTAIGASALYASTGNYNTAVGANAGEKITSGTKNTHVGVTAGYGNSTSWQTGDDNTTLGYQAGYSLITSAHSNTFIGSQSGAVTVNSGFENTCLGFNTEIQDATADNQIVIGNNLTGTKDDAIFIGNDSSHIENDYNADATWNHSSDVRQKTDIKDESLGLSFVEDLRPVTYKHKSPSEFPQEWDAYDADDKEPMGGDKTIHGFIAQEVKEAMDKAGVDTFQGWSDGNDGRQRVSFEAFVMPLIKAVQELSAKVKELENK